MRLLTCGIASLGLTLAAMPVQASELCGYDVHQKFEETRIYSRDYIAACKPGDRCRLVTYRMDDGAPLGFSHSMALQRDAMDGKWQFMMVDVYELADTSAGFDVSVDKNKPFPVETVQISTPSAINEYLVNGDLSDEILAQAKPGNRIRWAYKTKTGETREIWFSLIGLTAALEWADCAQAELAAGKSAPPDVEEKEPEYSPPEPDVPIDPVGDGHD
jgi:hypothetical protein